MRLSRFNLYVENYPSPSETLIHNTLSGAYVVLDNDTVAALRRRDTGEVLTDEQQEWVADPDLHDPDVGIVVQSIAHEEREFLEWFERRRDMDRSLNVIVGINLACNFACPYCSQAEVMDGSVMKPEVIEQTADWLAAHAIRESLDRVHVIFVGGEPLLHPDRMKQLMRRLRASVADTGIAVSMTVITNGYYLDEDMVLSLKEYGLIEAKVTLDGDETTHHLTRVHKRGENTFQRIFDNIIVASRHIQISINGNYQSDTVHGFEPLLAKLRNAGLPAGSQVTFTPALEVLSSSPGVGSGSCTWAGSDTTPQVALHDETLKQGFDRRALQKFGPCMIHDRHGFAIEPDGTIYKCPGFLGHQTWGIGDVATGLGPRYDHMLGQTPKQSCTGCAHRPNCGGGCLASEWMKSGHTEGVSCEKDYFERLKEDALTREFLLATADGVQAAIAQFPGSHPEPPSPKRTRRVEALRVIREAV